MTDATPTPPSDQPTTPPAAPPAYTPTTAGAGDPSKKGLSLAGFVLGIVSLVLWLLPILGFPASIVGIILSIVARRREPGSPNWMKLLGLILSIVGLLLTIASAIYGAVTAVQMMNQLNG